jgi:hypothetical protein
MSRNFSHLMTAEVSQVSLPRPKVSAAGTHLEPNESVAHSIFLKSIWITFSHLRLSLQGWTPRLNFPKQYCTHSFPKQPKIQENRIRSVKVFHWTSPGKVPGKGLFVFKQNVFSLYVWIQTTRFNPFTDWTDEIIGCTATSILVPKIP